MDPLDYWRLCDELSVVQAALLIVGEDPSGTQDHIDRQQREQDDHDRAGDQIGPDGDRQTDRRRRHQWTSICGRGAFFRGGSTAACSVSSTKYALQAASRSSRVMTGSMPR